MTTGRGFWMRWRVRAGYPVAGAYWILARPNRLSIAIGAILVALGLCMRAAAAGHLRKDRELATGGPYARTRNPLYLGSAFLAAGFAVAGHSVAAAVLLAAYFAAFYGAVIRNEEQQLRLRFGAAFEDYAAAVPVFLPRLRSARTGSNAEGFSWAQYRRNREYQALIGAALALGSLFVRAWLRAHFGR